MLNSSSTREWVFAKPNWYYNYKKFLAAVDFKKFLLSWITWSNASKIVRFWCVYVLDTGWWNITPWCKGTFQNPQCTFWNINTVQARVVKNISGPFGFIWWASQQNGCCLSCTLRWVEYRWCLKAPYVDALGAKVLIMFVEGLYVYFAVSEKWRRCCEFLSFLRNLPRYSLITATATSAITDCWDQQADAVFTKVFQHRFL